MNARLIDTALSRYPLFLQGHNFQGLFAFSNATQLVWHTLSKEPAPRPRPTAEWLQMLRQMVVDANGESGHGASQTIPGGAQHS